MSPSYRQSHLGKGADYDEHFASYPFRRIAWQWERQVLSEIVQTTLPADQRDGYLDFACGTGRVLAHLEHNFRTAVGVDVSPTMLAAAKNRVRSAALLQADITQQRLFNDGQFDLVTAFRFFANAEPALREQAIAEIARVVRPGGYFVLNNHRNCTSLTFRLLHLKAWVCQRSPAQCMRSTDVLSICHAFGFRLIQTHHWGVLPGHENKIFFPEWFQYRAEQILTSVRPLQQLATYQIFVCHKA
jgi:SAM-dependent methyltransferase